MIMETGEQEQAVGPIETAVTAALDARQPADPRDVAAAALAVHYARLIDEPAVAGKYADAIEWLRHLAELESGDRTVQRHVKLIIIALGEHTVMSDLGPKLQATLDALRLTPKARTGKGGTDAAAPSDPWLDELRARRDRKRHPQDLDSTTP